MTFDETLEAFEEQVKEVRAELQAADKKFDTEVMQIEAEFGLPYSASLYARSKRKTAAIKAKIDKLDEWIAATRANREKLRARSTQARAKLQSLQEQCEGLAISADRVKYGNMIAAALEELDECDAELEKVAGPSAGSPAHHDAQAPGFAHFSKGLSPPTIGAVVDVRPPAMRLNAD